MKVTSVNEAISGALGGVTPESLIAAVVIFVICLLAIKVLMKLMERILAKTKMAPKARKFTLTAMKGILYFFAFAMVFQTLGIDLTAVIAVLSALSLGLTLAAESIIANIAGGVVIMTSRPFLVGHYIEVGGLAGTVNAIRLNNTELYTIQGTVIIIPNKTISTSNITNYTARGKRRIDIDVAASYDAPTEAVLKAIYEAAESFPEVHKDPAPFAYLSEFDSNEIRYTLQMWVNSSDFLKVKYGIKAKLRETFEANGVEMTYGHLIIHMDKADKQVSSLTDVIAKY